MLPSEFLCTHLPSSRSWTWCWILAGIDFLPCGDACRAGLLHGLLNDMDWETTGRIASLMGSIKIERHGTQNHSFTRDEFKKRFKAAFNRSI